MRSTLPDSCHDQIKGGSRLMHLGKPETDLITTEIDLPTEKVSGQLDLGCPVEEGLVDACVAPESKQWIARSTGQACDRERSLRAPGLS